MSGSRTSLPHIGALDGLRGAAVAGVLLYHGDHLLGGYLGVDLFFVLSGYLITSLLLAEHGQRDRVALGAFWARRARRLLPALVLVLFGVAIYCVVWAAPAELARIRADALATIGYVANWRSIWASQSYFDLFNAPSPLQHTWSLAIEEQFYVFWPLIFVGLAAWWKQRTRVAVLGTAIALGAVSTGLMIGLYDQANPDRVYYGTDTRAFALFAGIAIAAAVSLWGHTRDRLLRVALETVALGSALILGAMWIGLDGQSPRLYQGGFALAGVSAALLILAAIHPTRGPIGWALSFPPLRWLGLISYGLYLWHWPVDIVLDANRTGITGWPLFALRTAVALTIAIASYHLVEMPIRRGALNARQWRIAIPAVSVALLTAIIATTAGATQRAPVSIKASDISTAGPRNDLLLIGDSVANSLAPGLLGRDLRYLTLWVAGCRLIHGELAVKNRFDRDCDWESWAPIFRKYDPKHVVVLIGVFDMFDVRPVGSPEFLVPGTPDWNAEYDQHLESLITLFSTPRSTITLLTIPCAGRLPSPVAAVFEQGSFDINRVKAANRVMRRVAARHPDTVQIADLFGLLCPGGRYTGRVDGVAVRSDSVHLSADGATLVADWLLPQLSRPRVATSTTRP